MTPHAGNGGKTKSSGGFCNENPTKSTWLPQSAFGLIVSGEPRDRARIFLNDEKNNAGRQGVWGWHVNMVNSKEAGRFGTAFFVTL